MKIFVALVVAATTALPLIAQASADPNKILHLALVQEETGFDPVKDSDVISATINEVLFERLLTYDYLARPIKLVPMVAESMPEVIDNGRTFVFKIRKGIYFFPDKAFKGKKRELSAEDFVYSFKRFVDPKNRSPLAFMLEGKIQGLDELITQAKKTGQFDYDAEIPGMKALDTYTLQFKLKKTDYNFLYLCAHSGFGALAREVVEAYGNDLPYHPVGTGPYYIKSWIRNSKIVLEDNPVYRGFVWNFTSDDPKDKKIVKEMRGKQMPQIGRVELSVVKEEQSRWLAFNKKQFDYIGLPANFASQVYDSSSGRLNAKWKKLGVLSSQSIGPATSYTFFNFQDPILGGYTPEKIALRRAMIMAYNLDDEVQVLYMGQAVEAQMMVPEGVVGHDSNYRKVNQYNPVFANRLLDHFGYKRGADGYRNLPDGRPLTVHIATGTTAVDRDFDELWKRSMEVIGIRMAFDAGIAPDNFAKATACKVPMMHIAWLADYPDGENFTQLLYGPNIHQSNFGCYQSPVYDTLFEKSTQLPNSPERDALFVKMNRRMEYDGAWLVHSVGKFDRLAWPWVKGFKTHPILFGDFMYMDIDKGEEAARP